MKEGKIVKYNFNLAWDSRKIHKLIHKTTKSLKTACKINKIQ